MNTTPHLLAGRYEVGDLIGRGGMADVHVGRDTRLGRQVAIKLLRSDLARDASFVARFRREAQSSAGLNHPAIVAVYDSGEDVRTEAGGAEVHVPYIVMEYVPGRTLREVLTEAGTLDPFEAARITEGVLAALAYSHKQGIVHRDIKPANVMISDTGDIKVMDFGIARAVADSNQTMTQTQVVIGTAQYLSPEQAHGHPVDARTDLYSTGCMLFELVTGRPPFIGDTPVAIAYQQVGKPPVPPSTLNPNVWPDLDAITLHALAKDREERYQSATAFAADLAATRMGRPVSDEARAAMAANAAAHTTGPMPLVPAASTEVLSPLLTEPTEVYAASPRPDLPGEPVEHPYNTAAMDPLDRRDRRSGAAYVALTLAVIGVLGLLAFGLKTYMDRNAVDEKLRAVPSVKNLSSADAIAVLRKSGFEAVTIAVPDDNVAKDTVISQDPPAGTQADPASTVVQLRVSSGKEDVVVPDLTGKSIKDAQKMLRDLGLVPGKQTTVDDVPEAKDTVHASNPPSGASAKPGDTVTLQISSGLVTVPKVTGTSLDRAMTILGEAGLGFTKVAEVESDQPEGTVLSQDAAEGTKKARGAKVGLTVAIKPKPQPTPTETLTPTTPAPTPSDSATAPAPAPSGGDAPGDVPAVVDQRRQTG